MGIQGLQSFVEIQCSDEAWQDIDFKELTQTLHHGKPSNAPSVLVVDAMSCLKHFYASNTDWVCGGQWNELLRNVENFVKAFRQINIELVVFFDGEQDTAKIQSWIQEEDENRQLVRQILSHVHNTSTFPPKRHFFAPKSLSTCLRLAFRCRDVVVCSTVGDLHKEIINYCKKFSCLGILGYHSDYLLLDAMTYFSSSHLKTAKKNAATSVKFNTDVIFRELQLDRSRLALFSTLLGNSFLPEEWLAQFHWSLLGPDHPLAKLQAQVGKQFILPPYDVVVRSVAKYVRDLVDVSNLKAIMMQVFRSPETTETDFLNRLQRSILHYSSDSSGEVEENGESESSSNYPTVSNIPKTDVLSSPSNGTSESNYQKRWQHWQQHQYMSGELLKTSSKVSNGISPSSSEPDVEKLVADIQHLQLKELDLKGSDEQDVLSPTQTLSAPDTPSTPTQEGFLLASPGTPETPKAFDALTSPIVFPPSDETKVISEELSTNDPKPLDVNEETVDVPSPSVSVDSEPPPPVPPSQLSPVRQREPSPTSSDDKSNEKPLSAFYAFISPDVLKTAKKRHQSGQMIETVYQVLSKGEIKIGAALEDENAKSRVPTALLYRSIRQRVYGILLDKKLYDSAGAEQPRTPPPSIREWCIYGGKKLEKPDMVEPVSLKWDVPACKQLWLGTQASDNTNRLKAFLSCMLSDSPSMTKTTMVPQRCIILCCVLRYLIQKQSGHPILRAQDLEAFLAQALSPHLTTECNVTNLSQIKVNKVDVRGVNLATIFMRGVETAIFANDACGSPIPWDLVCPWNYFDGKLFQSKLNITMSDSVTLLDLCDGNSSRVDKLERMKWCIMEGLGQEYMLSGLPSNRNTSTISLLPSPFFGPIPAHLRNAPPLGSYGNSQNNPNKSRGRGSKRPVSGLGGTLQVAGVPVAKFQGNRAGRGYNPNQQVVVGGRSSVDIGEHKSSLRGRGSRHSSQGRGVSWAPDTIDKDFDRSAGYRPATSSQTTNISQVNDFLDSPGNYSPKQQRRKKRGQKPVEQTPAVVSLPGEMNPPPLMPARVPMQDPNQMFSKVPAHFGTMSAPPHGRSMMMEHPPGNMGSPNLNQRKTHMVNTPAMMAGGVNPAVPKYNMMPGLGLANTPLHDKAMVGRGWWWEQMKQSHP